MQGGPYYLAIEGNIGAGKTTLAQYIAEVMGYVLLEERFEENPFLDLFYRDIKSFALQTELFFLEDRRIQLLTHFESVRKPTVADFTIFKTLAFARVSLPKKDLPEFEKRFKEAITGLKQPDLVIHLKQDPGQSISQIQSRGRAYEKGIRQEYLTAVEKSYTEIWEQSKGLSILTVEPGMFRFPYSHKEIERFVKAVGSVEFKGIKHFTAEHW